MPKVNQEEYEMLKRLVGDWRWIARDSAGLDREKLYLYSEKPYKDYGTGVWRTDDNRAFPVDGYLFQFIQWEDGDSCSIADLIREYEWAQLFKKHPPVKEEQEKEKVKIPQFVFDWIEECKEVNVLNEIFYLENSTTSQNMRKEQKLYFWLKKNFDAFAKAWLAYPNIEVEEEELLYRARLKVIADGPIASYLCTRPSDTEDRLKTLVISQKYISEGYRHLSEFTEDELKRLNVWGSDQWKIEEVEEND